MPTDDDNGHHALSEEPSPEDFEAAEGAAREATRRPVAVRVIRLIGVLFVVVALVFYLVVPAGVFVTRAAREWLRLNNPIHTIPLAPKRVAPPTGRT